MAPWAGLKLLRLCDNVTLILAVEVLAAAIAIDQMRPLKTTPKLEQLHARLRESVPPHAGDRRLDRDITATADLLRADAFAELLPL